MAHYEEVHNPLRSMISPEVEDMADDTDTNDDGEEVPEEDAEVKMGSLDPMFNLAMGYAPATTRENSNSICGISGAILQMKLLAEQFYYKRVNPPQHPHFSNFRMGTDATSYCHPRFIILSPFILSYHGVYITAPASFI